VSEYKGSNDGPRAWIIIFNSRKRSPVGPSWGYVAMSYYLDRPDWQSDLGQGRALTEDAVSNLGEVGRQRDLAQGRAPMPQPRDPQITPNL